ncbi:nickel pincer cofactor biosynthesis protein LarB [Halobacillus mangrovi]|uniref:1-(5-phosphoribosyl)-5-amino-4-imidazole-carboxylate carboxylase n=1 Tax=Halobacillus mangrovi TaxID=402384 RepID=A0A1W5ZZ97_9BACI|nr:nickel pincer cofactor biosynthesis protein LarB [Halobacillus mangrovi]ARI78675.1 1-(5-phosphoribosyl)-5-amino-4-imidazole-carboxylate carboxylase [Halobacillus mangrovi]
MQTDSMDVLLQKVKEGKITIEEAKTKLSLFEDMGFAKVDSNRESRTGFPEVVYGEGKSAGQIIEIMKALQLKTNRVLATRINESKAGLIMESIPDLIYNEEARTLYWRHEEETEFLFDGYVCVVCAGTSDLAVAEEAAVTAEAFGSPVKRFYDVGVAGIHRLFYFLEDIKKAKATVVVAGMEGALASVVGGLINNPIVAVPTSVGYGANFQGMAALLSMLNSCSPGISTVNIDNGFGAGYYVSLIHKNQSNQE